MIGLDTNILVRYLAQDDPVQSAKASALIETVLTAENPGLISIVAMVETAWVLRSVYRLTDREIAAAVELVLSADSLLVEREYEVYGAMIALGEGRGEFADSLIAALNLGAGCSYTLTFDRRASRLPGFQPLL